MSKTVILASDGISLSDTKTLEETVSSHSTSISNNATAIALKANSSDVYTKNETDGLISTEVNNRNSAIEQSASQIQLSVSETYSTKEELNDSIKQTDTDSGVIIHVGGPINSLSVDGNSTQDGTPTPDAPVPILSVDELTVNFAGKNLFGGTALRDAIIAQMPSATVGSDSNGRYVSFLASAAAGSKSLFEFPEVGQCTVILATRNSNATASTNMRVDYSNGTVTYLDRSASTGEYEQRATATVNGRTLVKLSAINSVGTTYVYYDKCGIFEGAVTLADFTPYVGITAPIDLQDHELCSLPDSTQDQLNLTYDRPSKRAGWAWYKASIEAGTLKLTKDSGFSQFQQVGSTSHNRVRFAVANSMGGVSHSTCNSFVYNSSTYNYGAPGDYYISSGYAYFVVPDSITSLTDANAWLAENPITLVYTNANGSTTIQLEDIELPIITEDINVWVTASPLTNILAEWYTNMGLGVFGKLNTDALNSRMTAAESSITQNANNIELKVSKDSVISSINQSAEEIKIQASKVNIDGTAIFTNTDFQTQLNNQGYATTTQVATAKSEAISAAASDATSKANAAQSAAISTAAADATSKANAAEANAKNDTTTKLQNYTTTTDMNTAIGTAKSEAISTASNDATSKANAAEANAIAAIPTDISELNNDTGFITNADVPTKVSELMNDSGFQTASQVNTTITGKGYQTSSQVESAITSKGYATTTQAQGYATTAEQNAKTYAEGQANTVNSALETYKTTTNSTLTSLQNQVDGQIEAWYKTVDPTLSNEPASTWNTDALKARHEGDIYYNVESGHSWRWMRSGSTYSWQQIPDSDAAAALAVAQNAQSLANSKRRIFTSTPTVPYDVGDLWVDGTSIKYANASKTDSQTYSENDWAVTATDDSLAQTALNAAGVVQDNLNSARTWYAECDDAAATVAKVATITPVTEDFVLTVGSVVYIKFAITNSAAVASITLNVNNTGAKRIQYTASGGNVANLPAVGYLVADRVYQFIYDGTYWVLQYNYNSNTTYNLGQNLYYNTLKAKSAIAAETIIVGDADGYAQAQAGITFDLSYPILWCTKAIAVDKTNYANIYTSIQDRNLKTHYSSFQGTVRAMVYLVGTVSGNTITLDSNMLTSTEPTTEDGKIYIPIGRHGNQYDYTSAPAYFFFDCQTTTLFAYLDGEFRQVTPTEIVSTHRIYYRTATANSSLTAPTTWIEEATGNVYNQWTTKVPPLAVSTASGQTKYLYLYTCEQRKRLDGTTVCTKVLLDENTTVIDGGSIITNSITANQIAAGSITANEIETGTITATQIASGAITADKLNATNINASNTLTIGALDSDTQGAILNSNISVGGRNLVYNSSLSTISGYSNSSAISYLTYISVANYLANLEDGDPIVISFDAKADSSITAAEIYAYQESGHSIANDGTSHWKIDLTTEWQHYVIHTTVKDWTGTYNAGSIMFLYKSNNNTKRYLRKLKIESGTIATDWTPAPEDVDTNISEAAKTATNYITADSTGIKIHMSSNSTTYQHQSSTATTYYVNGNKRAEVSANGLEVFDGTYGSEESVAAFSTVARLGKADGNKVIADSTGVHIYNVQGSQVSQVAEFGQAPGELTTTILSDEPEIGTNYQVPSNAISDISIMLDDQTLVEDTDYTLSSGVVTLLESTTVTSILDDSDSGGEESPEDVDAHSLTCEYSPSAGVGLAIGASVTRPGLDVAERAVFRHPSFVEAIHGTANADTGYRASRTDTGIQVFCGIGIGGVNHGVYSHVLNRWLINADRSTVHVAPHTVTDGNINIKSKWVYATTPSASKGNGWGHSLQYLDTAGGLVGVVKAYSLTTGEKGIQLQATRNIGSTTYNNGIRFGVDTSGNLKLAFSGGGRTLWRQALGFDSGDVASSYGGSDNAPKNAYRDIPVTFNFTHTYAPHVVATFSTGSTGVTMGGLSLSVHSITTTGCKIRIYNNTNDARNPALKWVAID